MDYILFIVGAIFIFIGSNLLIDNSRLIAISLGISPFIIGLTLIALGTSIPELAVALTSAIKKQHEMVVGNIIGSNIFNTVAVLAIPGLISPVTVQEEITTDYLTMLGLTGLLYVFFLTDFFSERKEIISRGEGFVLIMILSIYIYFRFVVTITQPV